MAWEIQREKRKGKVKVFHQILLFLDYPLLIAHHRENPVLSNFLVRPSGVTSSS